jgi:hypothetical protein
VGACSDQSFLPHAVLWEDGQATEIGSRWAPHGINNHGDVVGFDVLWDDGVVTALPDGFDAPAINDRGQVAGTVEGGVGVWYDGQLTLLPGLDASVNDSWVRDINDHGQVVWWSRTAGSYHAALWEPAG